MSKEQQQSTDTFNNYNQNNYTPEENKMINHNFKPLQQSTDTLNYNQNNYTPEENKMQQRNFKPLQHSTDTFNNNYTPEENKLVKQNYLQNKEKLQSLENISNQVDKKMKAEFNQRSENSNKYRKSEDAVLMQSQNLMNNYKKDLQIGDNENFSAYHNNKIHSEEEVEMHVEKQIPKSDHQSKQKSASKLIPHDEPGAKGVNLLHKVFTEVTKEETIQKTEESSTTNALKNF